MTHRLRGAANNVERRRIRMTMLVAPSLLAVLLVVAASPTTTAPVAETAPSCAAESDVPVIIPGSLKPLRAPFETPDPFLMAVYHKDAYPAGDGKMQAPRRGNGADFAGQGGYSMYHGDRVPGFPQHPHRGFETITATLQGYIDHTDSQGWSGRYGEGDLQWMTAGRGVVHGEMFPLIHTDRPNPTRFFQIWLNLPPANKMADPAFVMHWAPDIPTVQLESNASVTVWAGALLGANPLAPPPDSWAAQPENAVAVWFISLPTGSTITLPAVNTSLASDINRAIYLLEGQEMTVGGQLLQGRTTCRLDATKPAVLRGPAAAGTPTAEALVLQGRPIGAPVAQRGPFVMNTQAEIKQAYADYQRTQFGGWPWPENAMIFPADKGRFANVDGVESRPPQR